MVTHKESHDSLQKVRGQEGSAPSPSPTKSLFIEAHANPPPPPPESEVALLVTMSQWVGPLISSSRSNEPAQTKHLSESSESIPPLGRVHRPIRPGPLRLLLRLGTRLLLRIRPKVGLQSRFIYCRCITAQNGYVYSTNSWDSCGGYHFVFFCFGEGLYINMHCQGAFY